MIIYEPLVTHGYEWVNPHDNKDYDVFLEFDGQSRAATWNPVRVHRVRADGRQPFMPSDFPWLESHVLIMRRTTVEALRDILVTDGEILPLLTDDSVELFAFNSRVVDALDESRSSLIKFPGTDRIMHIDRVAFIKSMIEGIDIFRLPHRASSTYVSERFVKRANEAGLRGLDFNRVWSD